MSLSDKIALAQFLLSFIVATVGGILGVLGYLKLIKSANDNANERKEEIERNAKERQQVIEKVADDGARLIQDLSQKMAKRARFNTLALSGLGIMLLLMYVRNDLVRHAVEKKLKELEKRSNTL
jgi:hypothetical protein